MKPGELAILVPPLLWLLRLVLALVVTLWAFADARRRSRVALVVFCLWSARTGDIRRLHRD